MIKNKLSNPIVLYLVVYALILGFIFRSLDFTHIWAYGDLNPFQKRFIEWLLYSWKNEGLGYQYVGQNYLGLAFQYILLLIFGDNIAQKVIVILPFIIAFLTYYYFFKKILVSPNIVCYAASLLYSINPVTIMAFVGGGFGYLMFYALIPIIFYSIIRFFESYKIRYILLVILISPFFWNIYLTFWTFALLLTSVIIIKILVQRFQILSNLKRIFLGIMLLTIGLILIYTPTLIQLYFIYQKIVRRIGTNVLSDVLWNYKDVNVFNLLRFAGNHGSAQPYLGYNSLNYFVLAGLVLEIFALLSLLYFKNIINTAKEGYKETIQIILLSSWLSLLVSISVLLLIKNHPRVVNLLAIMAALRNPEKLMFVIAFNLTTLITASMKYFYSKLYNMRRGRILALLFILALILNNVFIYNAPAMDGTFGLSIRSTDYRVDYRYYKLKEILETIYPTYKMHRILVIPFDYHSLLSLKAVLPNYLGLPPSPLINISEVKDIYKLLISNNPYKGKILSLHDVKLVVVDKKFHSQFEEASWYQNLKKTYGVFVFKYLGSYFVGGEPSVLKRIYTEDQNFKLIYEDNNFAIFENKQNTSKIYITLEKTPPNIITTITTENLISNPSFKKGLEHWKVWPGRCASLRSDANGQTALLLKKCDKNDKVWSIAYTLVSVKERNWYKLGFCVKFLNGISGSHVKILWYNQTEKFADKYAFKQNFLKFNNINIIIGKWYCFKKIFLSPLGAKVAKIMVLCGPKANTTLLITNVSFVEVFVKVILENYTPIIYKRENPSTLLIEINSTKPFTLIFAEAYDPLWEAWVYRDDRLVEKVGSIPLYGVINGFWINETGNLTVVIRYVPQGWFELGLKISAITFALCLFYLVWDWRRSRGDRWALLIERTLSRAVAKALRV